MKKQIDELTPPHVGKMIGDRILLRRVSKSALARFLGARTQNMNKYIARESVKSGLLWKISIGLKHNFFLDIAAQLPPEFTNHVSPDTNKDQRIAALEQEVLILNEKLELLKEVVGRGN